MNRDNILYIEMNPQDTNTNMFKNLLAQIEMVITSAEQKDQAQQSHQPCEEIRQFLIHEQIQCSLPDKSTSQWIWRDDMQSQFDSIGEMDDYVPQTLQLKRVQSLRMQQENKLDQFIRTNSFINQEVEECISHLKQTMNLSPRKKKKIDKVKEKQKQKSPSCNHWNMRKSK